MARIFHLVVLSLNSCIAYGGGGGSMMYFLFFDICMIIVVDDSVVCKVLYVSDNRASCQTIAQD